MGFVVAGECLLLDPFSGSVLNWDVNYVTYPRPLLVIQLVLNLRPNGDYVWTLTVHDRSH
jgi:hypothetical protein